MRAYPFVILSAFLSTCAPKSNGSTDSDASSDGSGSSAEAPPTSTSGEDATWAVGLYYRPPGGSPTETLATIDVKPDYTADLTSVLCGTDDVGRFTVGWETLDENSIVFTSTDPLEPFRWFGSTALGGSVTLSKTDKTNIYLVTDQETVDYAFMGSFARTLVPVCLVVTNPEIHCAGGRTSVGACPDA